MPPRYAYWTILVDEQPTAFRAGDRDDLLPTFKRLKEKHPSTRLVWFQNGKIWDSRLDAQEAMRARGEKGRRGDARQGGGFRQALSERPTDRRTGGRESMGDRDSRHQTVERRDSSGKLEWQPRGEGQPPRERRLDWKPKGADVLTRDRKQRFEKPRERRKWIPKEEFKKSQGFEARRDKNWRPGGEHIDPRQKYKDAKKAKWTRFKQTVRKRWESTQGRKKKTGE